MKLVASVAMHLFLVPEGPRYRIDIKPMIHVDQEEHLRMVAKALREVAHELDQQATGLVLPPQGLDG